MDGLTAQTAVEALFSISPFPGFFQLLSALAQLLNALFAGLGIGLNFSAI